MKNRLVLLFFALLLVMRAAQAQRRRASGSPPMQQPDNGCTARTMVEQSYTADIVSDGHYLYFTDSANLILRMPKTGGTPEPVARIPDNFIDALALDDTTIYAVTTNDDLTLGSIWSVDKTGGTPHELAANQLEPYAIAVDANYVFFLSIGTPTLDGWFADGKLMRVKKDGTGLTTMVQNLNVPTGLATDGTNVYFTETGLSFQTSSAGLRTMPANGGQARALTTGRPAVSVLLNGSDIYYSAIDPGSGGTINRMPKSGGSAQMLVKDLDAVVKMVITGDRIYYFNTDDVQTIEWIPIAGGSRQRVIAGGELYTPAFVVDDCAIFYVDANGALARAPR